MSGPELPLFSSKSTGAPGVARPSKLPLFGRRFSDKHAPATTQPSITSPLARVRPSTVVRPFFAAHYRPSTVDTDAQRRRYPASQPSTPVRSVQSENIQDYQPSHCTLRKLMFFF